MGLDQWQLVRLVRLAQQELCLGYRGHLLLGLGCMLHCSLNKQHVLGTFQRHEQMQSMLCASESS